MAQNISIAVAFKFRVEPVKWGLSPVISGMWKASQAKGTVRRADAWAMRDEFFHLKVGNAETLENFLNKWGNWWEPNGMPNDEISRSLEQHLNGTVGHLLRDEVRHSVAESDIWTFQDHLRLGTLGRLEQWLQESPLDLKPRLEFPYFAVEACGIERALRMTVALDLLRRVKSRLCARRDCGAPFKIESKHERKFCSQYCGHIESVRKKRRDERKARRANDAKG